MLPLVPMIIAFAVGFSAGLLYRQMKVMSLIIFMTFVLIVSGLVSISLSVNAV